MEWTGKLVIFVFVVLELFANVATAQEQVLQLDATPTIEFLIIDPLGRRTGLDLVTNQEFNEIPEANYGYEGVGHLDDPAEAGDYYVQFITGADVPPSDGSYRIKVVSVKSGVYTISCSGMRDGVFFRGSGVKKSSDIGTIGYYQFTYNSNPSIPITLVAVPRASQVKGGLFNPTGSTLSVKAKPSVNFGAGNTLNSLIVTLRRLTSPSVTLGNVSSPTYGVVKMGADTTIGSYKYQKFITTANTPLNWVAGTEYELFTVPVQGGNGNTVTFELTNALAFGQYFVEINYSDKTDTMFYKASVTVPTVPLAPALVSPSNGAIVNVGALPDGWLTLAWNASTGATSYRLQLSEVSDFKTTVVDQAGITTTSYDVRPQSGKTYYWRVNATNLAGTSAYSSVFTFSTIIQQQIIKEP